MIKLWLVALLLSGEVVAVDVSEHSCREALRAAHNIAVTVAAVCIEERAV